ncbi:MAG: hypothetical protein V7642_6527 [Burkholderiales bacterium]|jgi:hypothetical protein
MVKHVSARKLYAMKRMSVALVRASGARPFGPATDKALRWAAAWGMASGIRTPHTPLRLRRDTLIGSARGRHLN